ncbi:uncharacterized protein [Ptychodera flava]|uniref:uncharacterized protein n=1 Tax=Ptychodera flava TaxID=63121 RepID=UPI00396A10D9
MEPRDREKLRIHRQRLIEELNVDHVVLYLNRIVLTEFECDKIYACREQENRVRKLLDLLPTKGPLAFQHFKFSLKDHYPHLLELLQDTPVIKHHSDTSQDECQRLVIHRDTLIRNLDMDNQGVVQYLLMEGVLTYADYDRIKSAKTSNDKARVLIDCLPFRGAHAYKHLILALKSHQPNIIKMLENTAIDPDVEDTYL